MSTGVVSVRISGELKQRLDALSELTGRSAAFYLREALAAHLDALEYTYKHGAAAEAERRAEIKAGVALPVELL